MSDFEFLGLLFILILIIYYLINTFFAGVFKEKKTYMVAASSLLAFVIIIISICIHSRSPFSSSPSNVCDDFYKGSKGGEAGRLQGVKNKLEGKKHNIDSKEIKRVIKQLEDPEEVSKLLMTLEVLAVALETETSTKP